MKKTKAKKKSHIPIRLNITLFIIFLLFSSLILRLGFIQIVKGEGFRKEVERTEDVTVKNSVPRGKIYDRNGKIIVDNKSLNSITYLRYQNTKTDEMLEVSRKLASMINVSTKKITERDKKDFWLLLNPEKAELKITKSDKKLLEEEKIKDKDIYKRQLDRITQEDINSLTKADLHVLAIFREMNSARALTPQIIKNQDVTDEEVAIISENLDSLPGIDVSTDWERLYPYDKTLRTVLGNVSKSEQGLPADNLNYYLAKDYNRNDRVGKSYIELQYEDVLKGEKSKIKTVTDRKGNVIETIPLSEGHRGKDLELTTDIDLQIAVDKIVEDELRQKKSLGNTYLLDRAFVVLMNPNNGEILAMSGKQYVKDKETGNYEIQDYALGNITSSYTMGSVVKGATVLTGYETGVLNPGDVKVDAPIQFKGTQPKKSWKTMGSINDLTALKQSSNVYMFKIAMDIGKGNYVYGKSIRLDVQAFDKMRFFYNQFGLGIRTGIDLPNESKGLQGIDKGPGKLLDLAIGQFDTYTPMQLAQYISTIANGGKRIKPHIVKSIHEPSENGETPGSIYQDFPPTVLNTLPMKSSQVERVQEGFRRVLQEHGGTGVGYFGSAPYKPAGKTGTAEAFYDGPIEGRKGDATMNLTLIGYAPFNNPEVAMAVVVPWAYQGNSDHKMNLSIGKQVMEKYFELKKQQ
ncbi:penicillin-binding transpeptidase domain-containing protein [Bacillus massiliigorillae]|uniref:penicillin-binding transpeptidase domain-containing protein n=1 Tax=Bacillus massiliigorillae TaxID=1243664 RepID=UPI00039F621B|nr:penicillin-binding transpeptidase domain-containing protein [Bacillus massiliigorillae]